MHAWGLFLYIYAESHDDLTARLRQFINDKKFELRNFSTLGLENVLVVPRHKKNQVQSIITTILQLQHGLACCIQALYTYLHASCTLLCQMQQKQNGLFDGFRRVVCSEDIFEVVKSVHEKSSCHSGVQKTFEFVSIQLRIFYQAIAMWPWASQLQLASFRLCFN